MGQTIDDRYGRKAKNRKPIKVRTIAAPLPAATNSGRIAGVWLVRRVSADRFYAVILALTFLIGVKLTYDAIRALA